MTNRLSESFIKAFGEKASKLHEAPSEKSNVEIIEAKLSHTNAKLNAARMGGAGNVGKLAEEKIRLERELEEAKGSRKNDSPVGDVKPEDVEDHVETPQHDGSKKQAPKRKADRSVSEERSTRTDPVDKTEIKGKFKDRDDKDIDNDGDVDSSDQYLHKRRKAIAKAMKKKNVNEDYAIYHKGKVFDRFDSKEEAQDAMNGMDLSSDEKKDYRIRKVKGSSSPKMTGKMMKEKHELDETVDPKNYEVGSEKSHKEEVELEENLGKAMKKFKRSYGDPRGVKDRINKADPEFRNWAKKRKGKLGGAAELQRRLANKMDEELELEEKTVMQGSKEHLDELLGYLEKAKPGSTDHSQIRHAIESMFGKDKIPKKHRNVKESVELEEEKTIKISFHDAAAKKKWMKKQSISPKEIVDQSSTHIEVPASMKQYADADKHDEIYQVR